MATTGLAAPAQAARATVQAAGYRPLGSTTPTRWDAHCRWLAGTTSTCKAQLGSAGLGPCTAEHRACTTSLLELALNATRARPPSPTTSTARPGKACMVPVCPPELPPSNKAPTAGGTVLCSPSGQRLKFLHCALHGFPPLLRPPQSVATTNRFTLLRLCPSGASWTNTGGLRRVWVINSAASTSHAAPGSGGSISQGAASACRHRWHRQQRQRAARPTCGRQAPLGGGSAGRSRRTWHHALGVVGGGTGGFPLCTRCSCSGAIGRERATKG